MIINNWHKINKRWRLDRHLELLEKIASFTVLIALVVNILCFVGIVRLANNAELKTQNKVIKNNTIYLVCSENMKNKTIECIK